MRTKWTTHLRSEAFVEHEARARDQTEGPGHHRQYAGRDRADCRAGQHWLGRRMVQPLLRHSLDLCAGIRNKIVFSMCCNQQQLVSDNAPQVGDVQLRRSCSDMPIGD